jgi:hypothetical protein
MTIDLRDKLLTDLMADDFTLDLSHKRSANRYNVSLEELNNTVSQLTKDSALVASDPDKTNWDCDTIYCFKLTYFILSGGGMSNEVILSCPDDRKDELMKKWKLKK